LGFKPCLQLQLIKKLISWHPELIPWALCTVQYASCEFKPCLGLLDLFPTSPAL